MSIVRVARRERWTSIAASIFEDERLTASHLGLITYALSRPDDWVITVKHLRRRLKLGRNVIYAVITDLIAFGYVERTALRSGGRFVSWEYTIHETPTDSLISTSETVDAREGFPRERGSPLCESLPSNPPSESPLTLSSESESVISMRPESPHVEIREMVRGSRLRRGRLH